MPATEADTRALAGQSALATTAIDTIVRTVTLPAGGPWTIFRMWAQVVQATLVASDGIFSHMRLNAPNGDLTPNPAPSRFPIEPQCAFLGATAGAQISHLNLFDVNYKAPGKSTIELIIHQETANIVAPMGAMGIIFGKTRPVEKPFTFMDRVRAQVTSAALTAVGTITLAESAKMITAVGGVIGQDNVPTTLEELIGIFVLTSDDIVFPPSEYPFQAAFSGVLGATGDWNDSGRPVMIPVNIPVVGGARIDCSVDLLTAVTNAAEVAIYIAYE